MIFFPKSIHLDFIFVRKLHKYNPRSFVQLSGVTLNWDEVRNDLISAGAHDVILVRAKKSIEDWFLYDSDSIVSFLRLKKGEKITGSNGYDKLKRLYKKANKMYFKGMQSNGMVEKLDIEKISLAVKDQLSPLYKLLGVEL